MLMMHRLHESLPSGVTRGTIWLAMCWRRRPAGDCRGGRDVVVDNPLGQRCFERRRGEALHPAREPLPMLEQIRRLFGARTRACRVAHLRCARIGE